MARVLDEVSQTVVVPKQEKKYPSDTSSAVVFGLTLLNVVDLKLCKYNKLFPVQFLLWPLDGHSSTWKKVDSLGAR